MSNVEFDNSHILEFYARNATLGSAERTRIMDYYESYWRCLEYSDRSNDFWGRRFADGTPAGAQPLFDSTAEASMASVPLSSRRPPGPSRLARTVVSRFTDAMFSVDRRPKIRVAGDAASDEYLEGIVTAGSLWSAMVEARNLGGALGSVFVSFAFHAGTPVFEVHNSKLCMPTWADRATGELASVDITYRYPKEVRSRKGWNTLWYWYRRRIDRTTDIVYEPVPVDFDLSRGDTWKEAAVVEHGFGFVPGVWVKNTRDSSSVDGEPDCYGQFEAIEEYDALMGLATMGTIPNADPTTVVKTRKKVGEVRKGSGNALILDPGDDASYMTLGSESAAACLSVATAKKADILQALSVVIEGSDGAQAAATATEIRHRYRAFHGRVDTFRGQYGEALKLLAERLLAAAAYLAKPGTPSTESGTRDQTTLGREQRAGLITPIPDSFVDGPEEGEQRPVKRVLNLPPKAVDTDDDPSTPSELIQRELGPGGIIEVTWPEHVSPAPAEVSAFIQALTGAEAAGYLDKRTAASMFAQFVGLNDPAAVFRKAQAESDAAAARQKAAMEAQILASAAMGGFGSGGPPEDDDEEEEETDDFDSQEDDE